MSTHSQAAEAVTVLHEQISSGTPAETLGPDLLLGAASTLQRVGVKVPQALELFKHIALGHDGMVSGSEQHFLSAALVTPALHGMGLLVAVMPTMDALRRSRRFLESFGIRAVSFDLAPTKADKRQLWEILDREEADVVLVSPGRLASTRFRERLTRRNISRIVVGQAHLMSPWSHRFVPSYRQIGHFLAGLEIPKVAHVWSIQGRATHDIHKLLNLKTPRTCKLANDVELIPHIDVQTTPNDASRLEAMNKFIALHDCQGVIHVGSLKLLYDTKQWLESLGETPAVVRPGMDEFSTQKIRTGFEQGEIRIVLSQGPFLSNLERAPGLEFIIFNGMPDSLETLSQEIFAHDTASPIACQILGNEKDFFHHRFAIDKSYPDSLVLRACFQGVKDAFGSHSMVPPETLKTHAKVATPYPEEDIALCLAVLHREGLIEHVLDTATDQVMVKLSESSVQESEFWHEYPLRKLDQISRLERTRDFLATAGDKGKHLASLR